jgi:hypothetical protein
MSMWQREEVQAVSWKVRHSSRKNASWMKSPLDENLLNILDLGSEGEHEVFTMDCISYNIQVGI